MHPLIRALGAGLATLTVATGALGMQRPASADTLVLAQASGLSISQAGSTAALALEGGGDPVFDTASDQVVVGNLPATTITASGLKSFTVTVSGTALSTTGGAPSTVAASQAKVLFDAPDLGALGALLGLLSGITVSDAALETSTATLDTPYTLFAGSSGLLGGSVTYTAQMRVTIPAGTPAGTYTGTVTQVVS